MYCVVDLVHHFVFRILVVAFYLCVSDSNEQNIFDQTKTINQIMIVGMLQNWRHRYLVIIVLPNL